MTKTLPTVLSSDRTFAATLSAIELADIDAVRRSLEEFHVRAGKAAASQYMAAAVTFDQIDRLVLISGQAGWDDMVGRITDRIAAVLRDVRLDASASLVRLPSDTFLIVSSVAVAGAAWTELADRLRTELGALPDVAGTVRADTMALVPNVCLIRVDRMGSVSEMLDALADGLHGFRHGDREFSPQFGAQRLPLPMSDLERDFLQALERQEIDVWFQPQYEVASDALIGGEALVRWNHPASGRLGSAKLLALAHRTGQTAQLSRYVRCEAFRATTTWPAHIGLSVNATAFDLSAGDYAERLLGELASAGLPPDRLTLELTEQVLIEDLDLARSHLDELRSGGMRFALDDFGAGYCNFRYLRELPLDWLKLDRSLLAGIDKNGDNRAVVRCVLTMATALGIRVCAEGVETEAQRTTLAEEGCAAYQGFLQSQAVPPDVFHQLTRARR